MTKCFNFNRSQSLFLGNGNQNIYNLFVSGVYYANPNSMLSKY